MSFQSVVSARNICKTYGNFNALNDVSFSIEPGKIVGLIGPNGAGKTTLLKGILGLTPVEGDLMVLGVDPKKQRKKLIEQVSFIADTAILPRWIKVEQLLEYVGAVHPKFQPEKAQVFLRKTKIGLTQQVGQLSKGMITQLHLALIMAIDSRLLVLDEPTLGLDIVFRKQFYTSLLNDYFDEEKTIIITTHQVEEVEHILTDVMFVKDGAIILNSAVEDLPKHYTQLDVSKNVKQELTNIGLIAIDEQARLGGFSLIFEDVPPEQLEPYGEVKIPTIADLFVAKVSPQEAKI